MNYRPDIDGLRAVAVLLVVTFHFGLFDMAEVGFIGVDVFFVISGFLITSIILPKISQGTFSFSEFYYSRLRRLAPALIVVLLVVSVYGAVSMLPMEFDELTRQVAASQFYLSNVYYWRTVNYFGMSADAVVLLHTWSLAVEEQFYLLYPLVLVALHRWCSRFIWAAISVGAVASFLLCVAVVQIRPEASFYLLPTRAWELLLGSLAFYLSSRWRRTETHNEALTWIGALLLMLAILAYREDTVVPGLFTLLPTGAAALLILGGESAKGPAAKLLATAPMVWIGKISYSFYLVHWPIDVLAERELGEGYDWPLRAMMFSVSMLIAAGLYASIEQPFRTKAVLAGRARSLFVYSSTLIGSVVLMAWSERTDGLPQRFPPDVAMAASYANDKSPPLAECAYPESGLKSLETVCAVGSKDARMTWAVFGDSHAWAGHDAFNKWLRDRGQRGAFVFRHSCPPITGADVFGERGECKRFSEDMYRLVLSNPTISHVLLVSTWMQAAEGRLTTSADTYVGVQRSLEIFSDAFEGSVKALTTGGKQVYVWEPVPGAKGNVPEGLARALLHSTRHNLEVDRNAYFREKAFFFDALRQSRVQIAGTVSPASLLCASGSCVVEIDGVPLYFDNNHITRSSAPVWASMLSRSIPRDSAAQ